MKKYRELYFNIGGAMKRRFKRITLMMNFVMDGHGKGKYILFVFLFIMSFLNLELISYHFESIAFFVSINEPLENNAFVLNKLLNVFQYTGLMLFYSLTRGIPTQVVDNKLSEIFEILPLKKSEIFLERIINLFLISIIVMISYFGLYTININEFYGIGIRGIVSAIIIIVLICLNFINISRFFRNSRVYKTTKIIGGVSILSVYLIPGLFVLINREDEINNIVNTIHGSSFVQTLGDKSVGIIVGTVLFSIYFILNYWYVRRQVYKD